MEYTSFLLIMIIDLLIPFIIAIPYKGYSHSKMVMSLLGCKKSPLNSIYNIWMVGSGLCISLFGYSLFQYYKDKNFGLATTLFVLILFYGIDDEIISGLFSLNEKEKYYNIIF